MKACTKCREMKPLNDFYRNKNKRDGHESRCKICSHAALRGWRQKNPEKSKAHLKNWYVNNRERHIAGVLAAKAQNPEKERLRNKLRTVRRRGHAPAWVKPEDFAPFYELARNATELVGEPYHVDHIVPLCGKTVSGLHVPWNLQVLSAKENLRKGNRVS
jgi:5-methylcytosine-specific restriction endonuclease McrA